MDKIHDEILNAIQVPMGSQCSCFSVGVMSSLGLRLITITGIHSSS